MGASYVNSSDPLRTEYQQYRAPRQNNSALIEPSLERLVALAKSHHAEFANGQRTLTLAGISHNELTQSARSSLIEMAIDWTKSYAEKQLPTFNKRGPLILSGHQPELFHTGVWFKNYALSQLAQLTNGVGIHLLIDSDQCRDVAVHVPTMRSGEPHLESVAMDRNEPTMPFEERYVVDQDYFRTFPERVKSIQDVENKPLLDTIWPNVCRAAAQGKTLGESLSQGRHQLELAHGNKTLELPLSKVCDTEPFRCFVIEILNRAAEFQAAYNGALDRYRLAHKLRNAVQPLPDLATIQGTNHRDWIESPFWIISTSNPRRQTLWCQSDGKQLLLTNDPTDSQTNPWQMTLEITRPEVAIQQLESCQAEGIKIRSRALTTTLYCRHILADLFLHGIGGAKYDQVTDDLSKRFFGVAPPPYAILTATIRLFAEKPDEPDPSAITQLQQQLRSYRYHPEQWIGERPVLTDTQQAAIDSKRLWVRTEKSFENATQRHQAIEQANLLLYDSLETERRQAEQEIARLDKSLRTAPYYTSREYSFVLFSEDSLVDRLQSLAKNT